MVLVKIMIFVIFTVDLTMCLVIINPNSVVSSTINNNNKSEPENTHLLTSVYDAIKHNQEVQLTDDRSDLKFSRIGSPLLIAQDNRNKRNTNNLKRSDYYYTNPHDSYSNIRYGDDEDEQTFISQSDNMCHHNRPAKENEYTISIAQGMSSISSLAFLVGKIFLWLTALLVLPFFILKAILIPFKIILGVKTLTVVNSIFFGAMVWRFLRNLNNQNPDDTQDDVDVDNGSSLPSLSNINQINSDYGEIGLHDVKRILKYVNETDKNW